jgi:hypothetical protein
VLATPIANVVMALCVVSGSVSQSSDPARSIKKLRIMSQLFSFAYETKRFQLRQKHPDWTQRQINHAAYALIERGCT